MPDYPCVDCSLNIAGRSQAIQCGNCGRWQHRKCNTGKTFVYLKKGFLGTKIIFYLDRSWHLKTLKNKLDTYHTCCYFTNTYYTCATFCQLGISSHSRMKSRVGMSNSLAPNQTPRNSVSHPEQSCA